MKKRNIMVISILIVILLVVGIVIGAFFIKTKDTAFFGNATVIDTISFSKVVVEVKENDNIVGNATINTTIFSEGDLLEVEGTKGKEIKINKIKFKGTTEKEKRKIISNIDNDVKINEYKNMVSVEAMQNGYEDGISLMDVHAIPLKIQNQEYELNLTPLEYFNIKYKNTDYEYITISDSKIEFSLQRKYKVVDVSLHVGDNSKKIDYKIENDIVKFNADESGVYSIVVEYENGDVLNYLFA